MGRMIKLFTQQEYVLSEEYPLAKGVAVAFSQRCPDKASANEDSAALISIDDTASVLIVADGVGGMPAGEQASSLAIQTILDALKDADVEMLREAILSGIELANQKILESCSGAATTLCVVEIRSNRVRPYHVGDSLILVTGQRGLIKFQNIAHSPTGYAVESGLINEAEAIQHAERHLVSNLVGTQDMRIEIGPEISLAQRDTLIVASDGVGDNLYVDEIIDYIRKGPLTVAASQLAKVARERMLYPHEHVVMHPDDLTFILFRGK